MAEGSEGPSEDVLRGVPLRRQLLFAALLMGVALAVGEGAMRLVYQLRDHLPPTPDESQVYEWQGAKRKLAAGTPHRRDRAFLAHDADLGWRPVLRVDADFRDHTAGHPDTPLYRPREIGGHFTEAGNRLMAETLAAFLRSRGLVDVSGGRSISHR